MNKIQDLKDETIRTLAQTLKESGLAASETEAIRMATNMAQTNKKANDTFEERKEKNIMGLSFLHKEKKEKDNNQEIRKEEVYAEESTDNLHNHHDSIPCESCEECDEHTHSEKSLKELYEVETKDEIIEQDLIKEEPKESEQPETTQEIPVGDGPKKDLKEYEESNVDLGDVFKFKG